MSHCYKSSISAFLVINFLLMITNCRHNKALVNALSNPAPGTNDLYFRTKYSQSTIGQFKACLWKQWWTYWRSPDYNLVRYSFTLFTALLLGTIFWKIGQNRYVYSSADNNHQLPKARVSFMPLQEQCY